MISLNKERVFSAPGIFTLYVFISWILIQGFRLIFPGENAPLLYYANQWRLLRGLIEFLEFYPALALSALVLSFAVKITPAEKMKSFSPKFFNYIKASILTAITATGIYAAVSLLALPLARDYESSLRYQAALYESAKVSAWKAVEEGDWEDVARFVRICEQIWPQSPEFERLEIEAAIRLEEALLTPLNNNENTGAAGQGVSAWPNLPDQNPPNAAEALAMAETAMSEERYFDAHWLATLGGRLAGPGTVETTAAARLASLAWNAVNSLEPNSQETEIYRLYRLKREGYEALVGEDWIRAYYIFLELKGLNPRDPDVEKYLGMSEQGCKTIAFFHDEMDFALGNTLMDRILSLPYGLGRMVIRLSTLTIFPDSAYGTGMEILTFDRDARPAWRIDAPYVKMLPFGKPFGEGSGSGVGLAYQVLDRNDQNKSWGPTIEGFGENPPSGAQLTIDCGWEDFLLLADLYRRKDYIPIGELLAASKIAGSYGYLPEVYQAEFLRRLANQLLFLSMAVMSLVIGWRYRAHKKSHFFIIPMIFVLPVVYNGLVFLGRNIANDAAILMVISFGFNISLLIFGILAFTVFIGSLFLLAAQHE